MNEKLKHRQYEILKMLVTATIPLDMDTIKNKFQKSERTIRYDINELKELCQEKGIDILYKTKQGFYIPAGQKGKCSQLLMEDKVYTEPENYASTESGRIRDLFFYFLVKKRDTIAEQIAGELYISRSTLQRLISRFNEKFKGQLQLTSYKTGGYELTGDEYIIRRTAVQYLAEGFKGSYTPEDWYLLLPGILKSYAGLRTLTGISTEIKKANAQYNVWLSNSAFINLLAYCIVRSIRIRASMQADEAIKVEGSQGYAEQLLLSLDSRENTVSRQELAFMERILHENEIVVNNRTVDEEKLNHSLRRVVQFLKEQNQKSGEYDFRSLYDDLYGHLKNTICFYLSRERREEENFVVIREIKENYPEFYEIAARCVEILEEDFQMEFTETEICYIGVYLYKNCKEKSRLKKKVLLVCATGKGLSHLLSIRVENAFPSITVAGQKSPYQISRLQYEKDIDFIISTIPLHVTNIPVVKISRILSAEDIKRIQEFLDYGKLVDEIPLAEQSKASFNSKADPFQMEQEQPEMYANSLVASATVMSKLILTLLEYTSKFPEKYRLEQDALLGLIIHMSMAIPRWFQYEGEDQYEELEEYEEIRQKHGVIYEIMEKFFGLVEKSLKIKIAVKEKIAFFLYIIILKEEA